MKNTFSTGWVAKQKFKDFHPLRNHFFMWNHDFWVLSAREIWADMRVIRVSVVSSIRERCMYISTWRKNSLCEENPPLRVMMPRRSSSHVQQHICLCWGYSKIVSPHEKHVHYWMIWTTLGENLRIPHMQFIEYWICFSCGVMISEHPIREICTDVCIIKISMATSIREICIVIWNLEKTSKVFFPQRLKSFQNSI